MSTKTAEATGFGGFSALGVFPARIPGGLVQNVLPDGLRVCIDVPPFEGAVSMVEIVKQIERGQIEIVLRPAVFTLAKIEDRGQHLSLIHI